MPKTRNKLMAIWLLIPVMVLSACGGGSSSEELDDETGFATSELQITAGASFASVDGIADADLQLFWQQVAQYDFYRLFVNPDGRSGFTKIGEDVFPEEVDLDDVDDAVVLLTRRVTGDLDFPVVTYNFDWRNALFLLKGCTGEPGNAECENIDFQSARNLSGGNVDTFGTPTPASQFQTTYGISVALSQNSLVAAVGANTATLFECAEDEIIEVDDQADENCEKQIFPACEDLDEDDRDPGINCELPLCEELDEDVREPDVNCVEEIIEEEVFKVITNAGIVYMYYRDTVTADWVLAEPLAAPILGEEDNFGWSVDLSDDGSVVVVTAPGEDSMEDGRPRNNSEESSGAAYVFRRDGNDWFYEDLIKAASPVANDLFGWASVLSGNGNWLAVSAVQRAACRGAVFVYKNEGGVWARQQTLVGPERAPNDAFGYSLTLDYAGKTIAVGANQFPDGDLLPGCTAGRSKAENPAGEVHIFSREADVWDLAATVAASNAENGDRFGNSVSFDRNARRLLVGAPLEDSASTGINGSQGNDGLTPSAGAAYLFEKSGTSNWQQTQYIKASNSGATDQFGNTVRLGSEGAVMAIGAWGEAGTSVGVNGVEDFDRAPAAGAVYIFREDATPGLWSQAAYVKAPFASPFAAFGWSLAISDTSPAMIVGAPGFISPNGVQPGNAFVY